MITVKELKELLNDIPDDAIVAIEADHGQHTEFANSFVVTRENFDDIDYSDIDNVMFEWDNWREVYDEDAIEEYPVDGKITGVLISY